MPEPVSFFVLLSILWFFFYWIFGGVFFSIVALLVAWRVHTGRFGCLFSLCALLLGAFAAWAGLRLTASERTVCVTPSSSIFSDWIEQFSCGMIGIAGGFLIGFFLLLLLGALFLWLSRQSVPEWRGR
jgi:hypothetical protein